MVDEIKHSVHDTLCGKVSAEVSPGGARGGTGGDSIVHVSRELCKSTGG